MTPRAENVTDSSFSDHLTSFPFHQQQRTTWENILNGANGSRPQGPPQSHLWCRDWTSFRTISGTIYIQLNLRGRANPGTSEYSTASTFEQQHITEGLVKLWLLDNILKQLKIRASLMPGLCFSGLTALRLIDSRILNQSQEAINSQHNTQGTLIVTR